jgi:hypothetical protein
MVTIGEVTVLEVTIVGLTVKRCSRGRACRVWLRRRTPSVYMGEEGWAVRKEQRVRCCEKSSRRPDRSGGVCRVGNTAENQEQRTEEKNRERQ